MIHCKKRNNIKFATFQDFVYRCKKRKDHNSVRFWFLFQLLQLHGRCLVYVKMLGVILQQSGMLEFPHPIKSKSSYQKSRKGETNKLHNLQDDHYKLVDCHFWIISTWNLQIYVKPEDLCEIHRFAVDAVDLQARIHIKCVDSVDFEICGI